MRPAQLTPENPGASRKCPRYCPGFNEAGAINAGKPLPLAPLRVDVQPASMRPAQLTPENHARGGGRKQAGLASMRPAQLTPENRHVRPLLRGALSALQ